MFAAALLAQLAASAPKKRATATTYYWCVVFDGLVIQAVGEPNLCLASVFVFDENAVLPVKNESHSNGCNAHSAYILTGLCVKPPIKSHQRYVHTAWHGAMFEFPAE